MTKRTSGNKEYALITALIDDLDIFNFEFVRQAASEWRDDFGIPWKEWVGARIMELWDEYMRMN